MAEPLLAQLTKAALDRGALAAGGVDLDKAPSFHADVSRYKNWISKKYHGEMSYLERGVARRADPRLVFPEVQSVFCALFAYDSRPSREEEEANIRYAKYLRGIAPENTGEDYHHTIAMRLDDALQSVSVASLRYKVCVDTSAVLERTWARLCGLGWIGKNTLLISPQHGSFTFIGVVYLNQPLDAQERLLPDYCGSCSRCLEACPTQAFVGPGELDSRRCISYLTLEKRGAFDPSTPSREGWVAGCDICQDVCPFNHKPVKKSVTSFGDNPRSGAPWANLLSVDRLALEQESEDEYRLRVSHSALSRIKPSDFKRNLKR